MSRGKKIHLMRGPPQKLSWTYPEIKSNIILRSAHNIRWNFSRHSNILLLPRVFFRWKLFPLWYSDIVFATKKKQIFRSWFNRKRKFSEKSNAILSFIFMSRYKHRNCRENCFEIDGKYFTSIQSIPKFANQNTELARKFSEN